MNAAIAINFGRCCLCINETLSYYSAYYITISLTFSIFNEIVGNHVSNLR